MKLKHGGDDAVALSDKTLRKFKHAVGDILEDILDVIHADNVSHAGPSSMPNQIDSVRNRLDKFKMDLESDKPVLPINGDDLINMGVMRGPKIGELLKYVADAWFDNPNLTKSDAIKIIKDYL